MSIKLLLDLQRLDISSLLDLTHALKMQQAKTLFHAAEKNISKIRHVLAFKDTDKMINAFLLCLNCCSAFVLVFTNLMQLSSNYNAAATLL